MSGLSRRRFLESSSIAALGAGVAATTMASAPSAVAESSSPNERLNLGLIGCGGRGFGVMKVFADRKDVAVTALCDVDANHLEESANKVEIKCGKRPAVFKDYRELLDMKDVDIVLIGTPDHWHALPTIHACQAGKDVYVEKPLSKTVREGQAMIAAARKYDRVVQMGTMQRSAPHYKEAIELVRSGELGTIRLVRAWAYLDWKGPVPVVPDCDPPENLDYDFWLGPAPYVPYNPHRVHFDFRWFWDYAGGLMTDWGAHMLDIVNAGMDVVAPKSTVSIGGKFGYPEDYMETPDTQQVLFEYDTFAVIWEHALGVGRGPWDREHGVAFHGNNGILVVDRGGWEVYSETDAVGKQREYKMLPKPRHGAKGDATGQHVENFIDCVRNRTQPVSDVEIGHNSMLSCHLANIAQRTGERIVWDPEKQGLVGASPAAETLLDCEYRAPWKLPVL